MRPTVVAVGAVVVALALAAGCSGSAEQSPPSGAPWSTAVTPPATGASPPETTATPGRTSASPRPTRAPNRRRDQAAVSEALVSAKELGRPWVAGEPADNAEEACPGRRSALERLSFLGSGRRDLMEGRDELVNGVTFGLDTLPGEDASAVRTAWVADTKACREHTDAYDYYVVMSERRADTDIDADEVLFSRVERVYFDKTQDQLAYARQVLIARTGRVITTVRYTFLTDDAAEADDFSRTRRLLAVQLAQVAQEFAE
jgi:hypothetical protein